MRGARLAGDELPATPLTARCPLIRAGPGTRRTAACLRCCFSPSHEIHRRHSRLFGEITIRAWAYACTLFFCPMRLPLKSSSVASSPLETWAASKKSAPATKKYKKRRLFFWRAERSVRLTGRPGPGQALAHCRPSPDRMIPAASTGK
ncbi:hypothetical protein AAFF_G00423550 [Aldrovandia affinis]|uniref:Uncharacterized protein n=1 Tax=Aldrovandia affinis TaxID=143900 RepID=A0AAD7T6Q3_9TELE|nr:hypothetical protein AAFF_G00423550 [Aldrovandia affinis]